MPVDLSLQKEVLAVIAILSVCILFPLYYYFTKQQLILNLIEKVKPDFISAESLKFISEKITGIILFGIIPFVLFILIIKILPRNIGFTTGHLSRIKYLFFLLISLTFILSYFSSKSHKIQQISPELRVKPWRFRHNILSALSWLIYLFGYEFFFRGILWFLCFQAYGFWLASGINVLLYSLVHIPKGKGISLGAIPLGILFCFLSCYTGSFFPAFIIHSTMAISTEIFSAYQNPEFRLHQGN